MQNLNDICTSRCTCTKIVICESCLSASLFCVVCFTVTYLCIQSKYIYMTYWNISNYKLLWIQIELTQMQMCAYRKDCHRLSLMQNSCMNDPMREAGESPGCMLHWSIWGMRNDVQGKGRKNPVGRLLSARKECLWKPPVALNHH